jgi:hypothetical protein
MNQFILSAVTEIVAVLEAFEYLEERASHGDRAIAIYLRQFVEQPPFFRRRMLN